MGKTLDGVYKNQSRIYKYVLYLLTVGCIVFFFPKGGKFKYEFQKGKPWQYENLYAPFDFAIQKTQEEIALERSNIESEQIDYFVYNHEIVSQVYQNLETTFPKIFSEDKFNARSRGILKEVAKALLDTIYNEGVLIRSDEGILKERIYLVQNSEAQRFMGRDLYKMGSLNDTISKTLAKKSLRSYEPEFKTLFFEVIRPNVTYDEVLTKRELEEALSEVSTTRGNVDEGKLIIARGEVVEAENLKILDSLKAEYESELWTDNNYYFILFGYTILVALVLMMLLLFLKKYRAEVFRNNVKVTFIFFNILLMVLVTTLVVKYNESYVFVVPLCIMPLILKTCFDA
ncbi:MAG: phosphohydrolase, partial [Eudoraea sp.]